MSGYCQKYWNHPLMLQAPFLFFLLLHLLFKNFLIVLCFIRTEPRAGKGGWSPTGREEKRRSEEAKGTGQEEVERGLRWWCEGEERAGRRKMSDGGGRVRCVQTGGLAVQKKKKKSFHGAALEADTVSLLGGENWKGQELKKKEIWAVLHLVFRWSWMRFKAEKGRTS